MVRAMKKTFAMLLSLVFVMAALSGCTGQGDTPAANNDRETLTIEIFERGDVPAGAGSISDNAMTQWAQENFGDPNNIELQYVPVPRAQETQQLNVLMAAKQAPDIIITYDYSVMYNYYSQGGLTDLTDILDEYGQNLKTFLGDEVLETGQIDGKQYLVPAKRVLRGTTAQLIRQDWLDKLGLPAPTTTEELYTVLKAFKEEDPGNVGDKLVPFAISTNYAQYRDLVMSFVDTSTIDEATRWGTYEHMLPGYKEGLRFMNKLYNEGLLSKDFALDKDRKQMESDIANGYVGFFNDDLGRPLQNGACYNTLKSTVPGAELSAVDTFTDREGKHSKVMYAANGIYTAVPIFSKNAENAVKYFEWMSDKDNLFTLQYGIEGRNYTIDEDGFPQTIESEESQRTHWYNLGFDMALIVNGKYIENESKSVEYNASATGENKELFIECYQNSINDGWTDLIIPPTEADKKYKSNYDEKANELCQKCIMAPVDQFDDTFDSLQQELRELGGDELTKERTEVIRELLQ